MKFPSRTNQQPEGKILSISSSVYDPLGFGAPFLLRGKQIVQRLCEKNLKWDTKLPEHLQNE